MNPIPEPHSALAAGKVPLPRKLAWGIGGANDYLMSMAVYSLVTPIFNVYLGLDVRLVGLAIAIPRLIDAFTDPLIGHLSDNTRPGIDTPGRAR